MECAGVGAMTKKTYTSYTIHPKSILKLLEITNFHDIILIAEPKMEAIDRKAGEAIKDFKEVEFPDDYNPAGKPSAAKRKV